jgi:ribosomal protein S18 acetylase RimI-like enzyme
MIETLRPPREEDLPHVVRLMSKDWPEPIDEETVRRSWSSPRIELELDARLDDDAYAVVEGLDEERVWVDLRGRPSAVILDWAEHRASEKGTRVRAGAWTTSQPLLEELERRGFRHVRHFQRMEVDLDAPISAPVWPDGTVVRTFRERDERVFYDLYAETFEDTWEHDDAPYEEWAHSLLQPPAFVPELRFLASGEDEPVGCAICHPHAVKPELGWVRILGVRRAWRRRGIGRALLLEAFAALRSRGLRRAGLGVDAESPTGAHKLYEQVGMHVSARFDIYEKVLA